MSRWASVLGGALTALSFEQALGLLIGVVGMSATWWLSIMRNRRESRRDEMLREEHEARMHLMAHGRFVDTEAEAVE